jgi:hypothetical protein
MTRRFKTVIIANIFLGLLLYLSSQLVLINLQGFIVEGVNIFSISTGFVQSPGSPPVPTSHLPLANFPLYVFLAFLIVNAYFIISDRETKQTPS